MDENDINDELFGNMWDKLFLGDVETLYNEVEKYLGRQGLSDLEQVVCSLVKAKIEQLEG
jgi:hypothetical protein